MADFWSRIREGRVARVLAVYLAAAWVVLQLTSLIREEFRLPYWVTPTAVVLLAVGLVIVAAAVLVQEFARTRVPNAQAAESGDGGAGELAAGPAADAEPGWPFSRLTWTRFALMGLVAFCVLFGVGGLFVLLRDRGARLGPQEASAEAAPGIAVLPFRVNRPDLNVWREGMVDLLSTNLDEVAGLRAIDSRTVLARWREHEREGKSDDLAATLDVARRTGARYALLGSAVSIGGNVRLTANIYEVDGGRSLWQGQVEGSPDDVLQLVDRLSVDVLRAIFSDGRRDLPSMNLAHVTTSSVPALRAYLEGEALLRGSDFRGAVRAFERAVAADSTFALAFYRLAIANGWIGGLAQPAVRENMERAARLAARLPERDQVLVRAGLALNRGSLDGIAPLEDATTRYPDDAEAWYMLGDTYFHLGDEALAPQSEKVRAFTRAVQIDPAFTPPYIHLFDVAMFEGDSARARQVLVAFDSLALGGETDIYKRRERLVYMLAFGGEVERTAAEATLDTLPTDDVIHVAAMLSNPFLRDSRARVASELATRLEPGAKFAAVGTALGVSLSQGRMAEVHKLLEDPILAPAAGSVLYAMKQFGAPVAREELAEKLSVPPDTLPAPPGARDHFGITTFYAGAYAAEEQRWPDHSRALAQVRAYAKTALATGDSTSHDFLDALARSLEGYGTWRRGRAAEALTVLQATQPKAIHVQREDVNSVIRWWIGELLLELKRPVEAKVYFASMPGNPVAALKLANIHEQLGEFAEARRQYELFLAATQDADPGLYPVRDQALAALNRLRSAIRE